MRVLVLSSQASNTGSTLRAFYIYKSLKAAGIDCDYIAPPLRSMPLMLDFLLTMFYYFFALMNRRYDRVVIVKPYPNTVLPSLMLKSRGAKIVIDIDDLDHGYRKGFLSGIIEKMQQSLVCHAHALTTHNAELMKRILKQHPDFAGRTFMLKQCVDLSVFSPQKVNRRQAGKIRKQAGDKKILFYMANLNIASYLDAIIKAVASKGFENTVLYVAGGGPLYPYYRSFAEKNCPAGRVVFLGPLTREESAAYISGAALCLVYYENAPVNRYRASMKLREYIAMNAPVVANGVGEIRDFRKYAYISGPSFGDFTAEIRKRIIHLDKRHKKGYKFISKGYDWKKEIRVLIKVFREI